MAEQLTHDTDRRRVLEAQQGRTMRPSLIGITHLWLRNVRWLGDGYNKAIEPGTVGDLEVSEVGRDGRVINANFHPGGEGHGYGATINPEWEFVRGA